MGLEAQRGREGKGRKQNREKEEHSSCGSEGLMEGERS